MPRPSTSNPISLPCTIRGQNDGPECMNSIEVVLTYYPAEREDGYTREPAHTEIEITKPCEDTDHLVTEEDLEDLQEEALEIIYGLREDY